MRRRLDLLIATSFPLFLAAALAQAPTSAETADDERLLAKAKIASDGPSLLGVFQKRTITEADRARIAALIKEMGSPKFAVRQTASKELLAYGSSALGALRAALNDPDAEIRHRAQDCVESIEHGPGAALAAATARLVRARKPAGSVPVLLAYLPFADDENVEEEVLATLVVLGTRDGRVDGALVQALADKETSRRAAAALIVGRSGTTQERDQVRPLLTDREARVRLRAAQGLLAARDKSAVPALIALLGDGGQAAAEQAEDLLQCVASGKGPALALGSDDAGRRRCGDAWRAWWKVNGASLDLAKVDVDVAMVDSGTRIREVARQFLNSWVKGDAALFRRTTDVPFNLVGTETYDRRENLDKMFEMIRSAPRVEKINFKIHQVVSVDEYVKTAQPQEKDFLTKNHKGSLRAVYVAAVLDGSREEGAALFARVTGTRIHIVGIGMGKQSKPGAPPPPPPNKQ
jgi:hypothetical protein